MNCEACNSYLTAKYGSGRFCCEKCARCFATLAKRNEINEKVSLTLTGRGKINLCRICNAKILLNEKGTRRHCGKCAPLHGSKISFEDLLKDSSRRKRLVVENGHFCWSCKLTLWQDQQIPLTIDHIDGNSDNNNNKRENLRILCWNCHALTPSFGGRNAKKFPNAKRRALYKRLYLNSK